MTDQDTRKAFERWAQNYYTVPISKFIRNAGNYENPLVAHAWECWQAALRTCDEDIARVRQQAIEECAKVCETNFGDCNARPNCHNLDAHLIRALAKEAAPR